MTDINHRRRNRPPVNQRHDRHEFNNGHRHSDDLRAPKAHVGRTDFLDKAGISHSGKAAIAGKRIGATTASAFTDGHRGMARAVSGAKKFVRSRVRFHDNAATRALTRDPDAD